MRPTRTTIYLLALALMMNACGAQKKAAEKPQPTPEPVVEVPAWHTCLIQNAHVTVKSEGEQLSSAATMQVVRDSMLVVSVMPMFGIEMLRLEATPSQMTAIDKIHGEYMCATYDELNRKLTPQLTWQVLQQTCSAELPTGDKKARLVYRFGKRTIELDITYPERKTDVPVRVVSQPLNRYKKIDITKWL